MAKDTTDRLVGSTIDGRYQIESRIARGGMAKVYLATDLRLERKVAVKVMHDHLVDDADYAAKFILVTPLASRTPTSCRCSTRVTKATSSSS
jgi:serine/threonine-protein kinase